MEKLCKAGNILISSVACNVCMIASVALGEVCRSIVSTVELFTHNRSNQFSSCERRKNKEITRIEKDE